MSNHGNHLIIAHFVSLSWIGLKRTLCHDHMIYLELPGSSLNNFFLNCFFSYKPINNHFSFLAYSVCPVNGLQINLRVPIWVKNDHYVCLVQVYTETTCSSGKNEYFFITSGVLEIFYSVISVQSWSLTVDSAVFIASVPQKIVQYIKQTSHLRKDQDSEALLSESRQQFVKDFKFGWSINQMFTIEKRRSGFYTVKKIWMISHLLKLH